MSGQTTKRKEVILSDILQTFIDWKIFFFLLLFLQLMSSAGLPKYTKNLGNVLVIVAVVRVVAGIVFVIVVAVVTYTFRSTELEFLTKVMPEEKIQDRRI